MREHRWRRRAFPLASVAALAAGALAFSGCLQIQSDTSSQLNTVGSVQVDTTICTSGSAGPPACVNTSKSGNATGTGTAQALVAYRIPAAAVAPATITSVDTLVNLSQSASYASEMQRLFPAPAGHKWVGYISQAQTFSATSGVQSFRLLTEFQLGQGANGTPFQTPFLYRTVAGFRSVTSPDFLATRPVVCEALTTDTFSADASTICFDSPAAATILTNDTRSTRDLGVAAGAATTGLSGTTKQVPFTLNFSGTSTAAANFAITGSSTIPGAVVAPSLGNLQPATNGSTPVLANVTIPANPVAGVYSVTLNAALANGQSRSNSVALTVPMRVSFTLPRNLTARQARLTGIRLSVTARNRGVATFKVFQGKAGKPAIITRRVTLRKGKNTVVLRSLKLRAAAYRVNTTGVGLVLNKAGRLK